MTEKQHIAIREETAVAPAPDLIGILQRLAEGAITKESVEMAERIMAMQFQVRAEEKKTIFMSAMSRLQAKLPQMDKLGQAKNSKFARLEDIDSAIRPLLAEFGFSFSFDEESHTDKTVTFVAILSHEDGHSETKRLTVPIDVAAKNSQGVGIRPAIQDAGSTVSYARRYLVKMHLNIVERDEDTDGERRQAISDEQQKDLLTQVQDAGMNLDKFLVYMRVGKMSEILASDWDKAQTVIRAAIAEKKK